MHLRHLILSAPVLCLLLTANAFAPPPPKEEKTTPPWELARAKVEAAKKTCMAVAHEYLEGKANVEQVHQWSRRWMDAEREVSNKKTDQMESLKAHVNRMQQLEKAAQDRLQSRKGLTSDVSAAEYHRLEAEMALSRTRTSR